MYKALSAVALTVLLTVLPSAAATLSVVSGALDLVVIQNNNDFSIAAFDLRKVAAFNLLEGSINSVVVIGDGTNLGGPAPASPNNVLLVSNQSASQAFLISFSNVRSDGGSGLLADANFLFSIGAISDPELVYLSSNPLTFSFVPNNIVEGGGNFAPFNESQTISYWLVSGGVGPSNEQIIPEPNSMVLFGGGALGLFAFLRHRRKV